MCVLLEGSTLESLQRSLLARGRFFFVVRVSGVLRGLLVVMFV